jgi:subtilisin family serine protease
MLGKIAFLGSGETSLAGGRIFERLVKDLSHPPRIAILEITAGFELNSDIVAKKIGDYLETRLQNYNPQIHIVPARKRGTNFSPDNPDILEPLRNADLIFMGPGSPTYAVRQLKESLAWEIIRARHRQGATLVFASAATIAVGAHTLPVYEIFKVGEDIHVKDGLDLFKDYNLPVTFIPHWNNAEGGADLDTSRCFVGRERFDLWRAMLPAGQTIVGLDEHTGIIIDFERAQCEVSGVSSVTICDGVETKIYPAGKECGLNELGTLKIPDADEGISDAALEFLRHAPEPEADTAPPADVLALADARQRARVNKEWAASDSLRDEIASLGWEVRDTPSGQELAKK